MTRKSSMVGTVCGHVISSAGSDPAGTENSPVTGTLPFVKILVKFRTRMVKLCGLGDFRKSNKNEWVCFLLTFKKRNENFKNQL